MKKLIVTDLMGTLIEADHVVRPRSQKEYSSRVATCGRNLNELLESGIEVIILTSLSHTTIEDEKIILNDIYATISDTNKTLFKIILTDVKSEEKQKQIMESIDRAAIEKIQPLKDEKELINALAQDGKLELLTSKDEAYEQILKKYKGYQISAIDDHYYTNKGFAKVLNSGGAVYTITYALASIQWNLGEYKEKSIKTRDEKGKERSKVRPNSAWRGNYEFCRDNTFPHATYIEYIDRLTLNLRGLDQKIGYQLPEIPEGISAQEECAIIASSLREINDNWDFQELIKKIALIQGREPEELWNICQQINSKLSKYHSDVIDKIGQLAGISDLYEQYSKLKESETDRNLYPQEILDAEKQWEHYIEIISTYDKEKLFKLYIGEMDYSAILNSLYGLGEISTNDLYVARYLNEEYFGITVEEMVRAYKDGRINLDGSFRTAERKMLHR